MGVLLGAGSGYTQDYNSYSFNELYDLESRTVYDIFQDDKANIWLGTNDGLIRFNGVSFSFYTVDDYSNAYTNIQQDREGSIWCSNFRGQLFRLNGNKLETVLKAPISSQYVELYHVALPYVYFTENIGKKVYRLHVDSGKLELQHEILGHSINCGNDRTGKLLFIEQRAIDSEGYCEYVLNKFSYEREKVVRLGTLRLPYSSSKNELVTTEDGIYFVLSTTNTQIFKLIGKEFKELANVPLDAALINQVSIFEDEIFFATKSGFGRADLVEEPKLSEIQFDQLSVSKIFKDREGNWWFGTLNDGVSIVPNRKLENARLSDSEILYSCRDNDGTIYYVNRTNGFYKIKAPYTTPILISNSDLHRQGKMKFNPFSEKIYFSTADVCYDVRSQKFEELSSYGRHQSINYREILFLDQDNALVATYNRTMLENITGKAIKPMSFNLPNFPSKTPFYTILKNKNSYSLARGNGDNGIYVNYFNGLVYYNNKVEKELHKKNIPVQVVALLEAMSGGVWGATTDGQLIRIKHGKIVEEIALNCTVEGILEDDKTLYFWSKGAVLRLDKSTEKVVKYDYTDGLMKGQILDIYCEGSDLIIVSESYLQRIPKKFDGINHRAPVLSIDGLKVFGKPVNKTFEFDHDENSISIFFSAMAIRSQKELRYEYRLNKGAWVETTSSASFARFPQLAPGNYLFEVRAKNEDGVFSEIQSLSFFIDSHFTEKWWFSSLIILVSVLAFYALFRFRFLQIRKENDFKTKQQTLTNELYRSKISAIRSQMNPHFMFNALNTIQEFIVTNQKEIASEYLADFADLMRKYLEQSKQAEITIAEEIETLEIYLGLENLRVDGKLHYKIMCEPTLNPYEITIPVMLLQPFIENSIKHGLLHKAGERKLSIQFNKKSEGRLECSIIDNGIGRKASQAIHKNRNSQHTSFATEAIDDKVDLMNKSSDRNLSIETIDLEENGVSSGTRVMISLDY
ncbi:MAG: histidine kinase [Crocinitomicaceae bacterium]